MFDTIETREIGPYVVHELIGWGGMSRVYRATDTAHDDSEVAIKVLSDSIVSDQEYQQRFLREIDIASLLDHPHILPVLDFGGDIGDNHNLLFMVMPLVRGGTLAERLRATGPISARQAAIIAEQVGTALDYAHSFSIVHRDIKPGNIMVMDEENYQLADFGLVKHVAELAEITSGNILGSPMYMSPEQARGEALDHRTDLYSLGLVLFECLTGRLPYNLRSLVETLGHHITAPPITPHQINEAFPPALEVPLLRAIEKERDQRYESGRELAEAMRRAVNDLSPAEADRPLVTQEDIIGSKNLVQQATTRIVVPDLPQERMTADAA